MVIADSVNDGSTVIHYQVRCVLPFTLTIAGAFTVDGDGRRCWHSPLLLCHDVITIGILRHIVIFRFYSVACQDVRKLEIIDKIGVYIFPVDRFCRTSPSLHHKHHSIKDNHLLEPSLEPYYLHLSTYTYYIANLLPRLFTRQLTIMPLVPPGMNPTVAGSQEEWSSKLVGKKLTDSSAGDVNVSNANGPLSIPRSHVGRTPLILPEL